MDPKVKQSLLEWLDGMISHCAEKSALDQRFQRLHKCLTEYSEFVKRPEADEHMLKDPLLSNELDAFEREGLLEPQAAKVLRNMLHVVNPPNPNAGEELYRMAYGPRWKGPGMVWLSTLGASAYIYFRTGNFHFALGGTALGLLIYGVFVFTLHRSVFRREGTSAADLLTPQVIAEKAVMGTLIPLVTAFILVWRWG